MLTFVDRLAPVVQRRGCVFADAIAVIDVHLPLRRTSASMSASVIGTFWRLGRDDLLVVARYLYLRRVG